MIDKLINDKLNHVIESFIFWITLSSVLTIVFVDLLLKITIILYPNIATILNFLKHIFINFVVGLWGISIGLVVGYKKGIHYSLEVFQKKVGLMEINMEKIKK